MKFFISMLLLLQFAACSKAPSDLITQNTTTSSDSVISSNTIVLDKVVIVNKTLSAEDKDALVSEQVITTNEINNL